MRQLIISFITLLTLPCFQAVTFAQAPAAQRGRAEAGELRAQRTLERVGEYLGIGIANVITGLGVTRVIVSGRLVYGWKFLRAPLHAAVAQSMAGRLSGWSVEPGEATGAGLGGALEVAAEGFITSGLV